MKQIKYWNDIWWDEKKNQDCITLKTWLLFKLEFPAVKVVLIALNHGLRTPDEGINQRNLKIWADVAEMVFCYPNCSDLLWEKLLKIRKKTSPPIVFFKKIMKMTLLTCTHLICIGHENMNAPSEIISTQVWGTTNYDFAQKKCIDQFSWKLSSWHTMFYSNNSHPESSQCTLWWGRFE